MTHLRRAEPRSRLTPVAVPLVLSMLSLSQGSSPAGPPPSPAGSAGIDTVWFGGTVWDPVDMRWEAVRDSVWTFGSGVGSSINTDPAVKKVGLHRTMEGWSGYDLSDATPFLRFLRRTGLCALDGSYSLHAGSTEAEADSLCWVSGQGYGNNMAVQAAKSFIYPGAGQVGLGFRYAVETEPDYDLATVRIDTTGDGSASPVLLGTYSGAHSGTATLILNPGTTLRSTPGPFTVLFQFFSDPSYSDEDGGNSTTCGHSTIDDISLSGAVTDLSTFESGYDDWTVGAPANGPDGASFGVGDWSDIVAEGDLPPTGPGCACDFADSVLVFFDSAIGAAGGHATDQHNLALSPWIDLHQQNLAPQGDLLLEFAGNFELPLANDIFVQFAVQYAPLTCSAGGGPISGVELFPELDYSLPGGNLPVCACSPDPVRRTFTGALPAGTAAFRIGIGVVNFCRAAPFGLCSGASNTTPWIDNVRVGVVANVPTGVSDAGVPARVAFAAPRPNPAGASGEVTLRFSVPGGGRVRIDVYDVAGRHVRTIMDESVVAGWKERTWDLRDAGGRVVPSGLYFVRFAGAGETATRKVIVRR